MIENILLILLIVILGAKLIGGLFERIGLDSSIGELLTGIILGPSLLGWVSGKSIETFAIIGSVFILFIAGMKQSDVKAIAKDNRALRNGVLLLVIVGSLMTLFFFYGSKFFGVEFTFLQAIVLGLAFAVIDVGVPAKVLISKGLINQPVGIVTIRTAIINIILGLCAFTLVTIGMKGSLQSILLTVGGVIGFLLLILALFYSLSKISYFVMRLHIEEAELSLALVLILALAYFTEVIGFSNVLGAFLAGVAVSKLPFSENKGFTDKIKSISFGLFIPLFFVWFGLEIQVKEIVENLLLAVVIFVLYVSIRFTVSYLLLKHDKMPMPELISTTLLSVDVESLVIILVAMQLGIFTSNNPLPLFAPSVLFSTLLIVLLISMFSKKTAKPEELVKKKVSS